jgi:hypothetical protein
MSILAPNGWAHMTTDTEHDEEPDHAQAMIDWLANKEPDVWFEVTQHLNWDNAFRVLDWIISQPQCDKANAAGIFWGADPLYHLRRNDGADVHSESFHLLDKVLRNWEAGFYTRAELAWDENWRERYRAAVATRPGRDDPFAIPDDLLDPLKGRAANVPEDLRAETNVVLYDLLHDLGTDAGWRPGSREWREARDPYFRRQAELARQRAAIVRSFVERLEFWWRSLRWIAPLSFAVIGGAFLLRWINKGVLF